MRTLKLQFVSLNAIGFRAMSVFNDPHLVYYFVILKSSTCKRLHSAGSNSWSDLAIPDVLDSR